MARKKIRMGERYMNKLNILTAAHDGNRAAAFRDIRHKRPAKYRTSSFKKWKKAPTKYDLKGFDDGRRGKRFRFYYHYTGGSGHRTKSNVGGKRYYTKSDGTKKLATAKQIKLWNQKKREAKPVPKGVKKTVLGAPSNPVAAAVAAAGVR